MTHDGEMREGRPLVIDLFCGLGGWSEGFIAEGYDCIGFDIERHDYGSGGYPGQLVIQDVRTLHGSQFKDAVCIVASPPCQTYRKAARVSVLVPNGSIAISVRSVRNLVPAKPHPRKSRRFRFH